MQQPARSVKACDLPFLTGNTSYDVAAGFGRGSCIGAIGGIEGPGALFVEIMISPLMSSERREEQFASPDPSWTLIYKSLWHSIEVH